MYSEVFWGCCLFVGVFVAVGLGNTHIYKHRQAVHFRVMVFFLFYCVLIATEYSLKLTKTRSEKASLCLLAIVNLALIGKQPVGILVCSFPSCLNIA